MEFLILGPLEVRNGGYTVRLGAAKQRALLGVLLLHVNEAVSTSRLVDELWGERPPATAEKLIQGYVHALRKQLGAGVLETRAPGYRLVVEPSSLDLLEFERLAEAARAASVVDSIELRRRALALWRGWVLADLVLEGPERHNLDRLNELRLTTRIEQLEAELQLGRHAQLVGELEAIVAEHPYRERTAALLMLALYRSGRQAEALEVYRDVRRRLSDELGIEPGHELRDLEASILRQDDALRASPQAERTRVAAPRPGAEVAEAAAPALTRPSRRRALGALLAVLAAAAVIIAAFLLRGEPQQIVVPPNSVVAIDPETNRVAATFQAGIRPGPVAAAAGSVWVGNLDDRSLTRIDTAAGAVAGTIPLPTTPTAIAVGRDALWVVNARLGTLYRVDPQFETVESVEFGVRSIRYTGAGVDLDESSVWAAYGESTLARVQPRTLAAKLASTAGEAPAGLVVAYGSVWVASSGDNSVRRFSPRTFDLGEIGAFTVGRGPSGIAAGDGSIWVACTDDDYVARLRADLQAASHLPIPVGDGPRSVAFGAGGVWVTNTDAGTVSRIDPESNDVDTIEVGNAPAGIAIHRGLVWVSVQAARSEPSTP
jgi:YVTN family beta-propeller protein